MTTSLQSWGRYPLTKQQAKQLYWRDDVKSLIQEMHALHQTTLPFGKGRSYGDSCYAASHWVLETKNLNKWIAVDWQQGIITVEAGITLEEILQLAIPNGWFLPVTPGTKFVTLGGAIANDVHGKNHHHRGTLGLHVLEFGLARSDRDPLICSINDNIDLFAATIGGLGLTGIITWVKLKLLPINSNQIDVNRIRFNNLAEFFALSNELDDKYEYSVAWVDCFAKKNQSGRGILSLGNHAQDGKLTLVNKYKFNIPFTPPIAILNNLSTKIFNQYHFKIHSNKKFKQNYDAFFYPLDAVLAWNKIYGPKGLQQYQCVIPTHYAAEVIPTLFAVINKAKSGACLAVIKRCGASKSPGLLSFPLPGFSLALDFVNNSSYHQRLFTKLDDIVHAAGGRLYPAKDARMSSHHFKQAYPSWLQLELMRDPALLSTFWQRVTQS